MALWFGRAVGKVLAARGIPPCAPKAERGAAGAARAGAAARRAPLPRLLALVLTLAIATACSAPAAPPRGDSGPAAAAPPAPAGSAAAPTAEPAAPPQRLRVGPVAISGAITAAWVTQEAGRFAAHGLDVELIPINASPTAVQALVARELDVLHTALGAVLDASLAGADLVMVASTVPALVFSLYAAPEIARVSDLRGLVVGANRPGTTTDFAARRVLRDHGLDPDRDVTLLGTGSVTNTLAALQSGQVAAGVVSPPSTLKAAQSGFRELVDLSYIEYHTNGVVVRREFLERNRDVVRRYLTAVVEGIARARQDKAFAKATIGKYSETTDDAVLEETYERYVPRLLQPIPYVTPGGVQLALDEFSAGNPQAQGAQPERFYDNSLLQEIEQSGALGRLYR